MARRPRNWRTARQPVRLDEITAEMLTPARRAADKSWLPQTVWPSKWFGRDFLGTDCLLANAAAPFMSGDDRPADAAEESQPLLTVLPARYWPEEFR